ncbi:hypothetical protein [Leptospirillum ferriphilum]|uniref:hypothetical protein n=1 Tax=Leptospirillum ferriphilum TaxID=178606 RepID=UPI00098730A7|nr:hypothetical protein [Leptospirillum ferriphilum]OOH80799.1 hypothetical protein BOX30_05530 [Leptospirillum ferriphilum]
MDRIIEYPMEQIIVDDFLNQRVLDMIALGKLISAILGTQTMVEGLACTPTSPASMSVNVAPGQIFFLEAVDTTTYGDLSATANIIGHSVTPANTTIMKQGMILSETTFALTAPSTSGDSVNYLISANYEDSDAVNTVLNYYNSSNPSQPFQGPNNSGTAQPTVRQGKCVLTLTAGTAAPTGTQTTPEVPSGQIGLWVITVPYGATSITSSNISAYSGAPFLTQKLFGLMNESVPLTIPNATAPANPVALGQVLNGVAPVAAYNNTTSASFSATTGTLTAPCNGYALVIASFSSSSGTLSDTGVASSLSGLVTVINPDAGNYFNQSIWYLPMSEGQSSTFTATLSQNTAGAATVVLFAFFQPNP